MSDRMANELLFGVLAFQAQLITESALRAAVEELSDGGGDKSLADILVEQQAIAPEVRAALEPLVAAHVRQHADDPEKSLAALSSVSTLVRDLWIKIDPDHTHAYHASQESAAVNDSGEEGSRSQRSRGSKPGPTAIDSETLGRIDKQVDQYEDHWDQHGCPRLDAFLAEWTGPHQDELFRQLLLSELHRLRMQQNREIAKEEYLKRFPQFEPVVQEVFRGETLHDGSPRRFRILKRHAAGGLGVVYSALDQELGREVALKEILPSKVDVPDLKRRFRLEAEITGGLEHPGIVPIYSLGRYQDGRPFYAMRFIEGDNLQEAIKKFHTPTRSASEGPPSVTRSVSEGSSAPLDSQTLTTSDKRSPASLFASNNLQFRELLGRFVDVCQAIAYAHSRGVLHRDLKPGNVMLGKYGETLIIDWGLAKRLQKTPDSLPINDDGSQESVSQPATAEHHDQTQAKTVLGDPRYMSPEQAAGQLDELGPATDVFSLGAILFELITGQPPIGADIPKDEEARLRAAGELTAARVTRAKAGDFPTPRQLRSDIPPALEAVCLKAMSFRPAMRYESAQLLAADIERWLADEPVTAWREPFRLRASRWTRRHQTIITTTAATLLVAIVGMSFFALILGSKNTELLQANREEQKATQRATKNADDARQSERKAERNLYVSRMNLAQAAWEGNRVGETRRLLDLYRLPAGEEVGPDDLRDFEWFYWDHMCHSDLLTLKGHTRPVTSVAFSPDGQWLASASHDGTVKVWDAATGQETLTLKGHTTFVNSVAFSADGHRLASASYDKTVKVWDTATGQETLTLKGHTTSVSSVVFSPDGQQLASASGDKTVKVWDSTSGQETLTLKGHSGMVNCVAFSADGKRLASASDDQKVKVWDAVSGQETLTLDGHLVAATSVAFSPDGRLLATGCFQTVTLWDVESGQPMSALQVTNRMVTSVAFSADGQRLASSSLDQTVMVLNINDATGEERLTLKGHTAEVTSVAFRADGQRLASASGDGTVKVWDAVSGQDALRFKGHTRPVDSVAFSTNGRLLASASRDRMVKVWDAASGRETLTFKGHTGAVRSVAFSADRIRLASAGDDMSVKVWDAASGQEMLTLKGHTGMIWSVVFSADGQRLASASEDGTVKVWNTASGQETLSFEGHTGSVRAMTVGPNGQRMISLVPSRLPARSVAFSPDGKCLASASADQTVKLWDAATGQESLTLKGHTALVTSVAFSPDGLRLASASLDTTVKIWDAVSGYETLTLKGHVDSVRSVAFNLDGTRLASASFDGTVKVWDVISGQDTLTLKARTSKVDSVAFSPDGQRLASTTLDGTVEVWDSTPRQ